MKYLVVIKYCKILNNKNRNEEVITIIKKFEDHHKLYKDLFEVLEKGTPVFATVAPSIVGQFGDNVTLGQIRSGLKQLGFKDMVEVALFADMLTIKEAYEFNRLVKSKEDFFLTSCCCPIWINLVRKNYPNLFKHMSLSVSPMIASGRILKKLYKDAKVVFIGPCIAKKAEAKEPKLIGDVDIVLTYQELDEIFKTFTINLDSLPDEAKDESSYGGRSYARTGGVSFSVKTVVNRIAPKRLVKFKPKKVDGVLDCKIILDDLAKGKDINANFIEGMGCKGGCIGGPKTNISIEKALNKVNEFSEETLIMTPFDNNNIIKTLKKLGLEKYEDIAKNATINNLLTRDFNTGYKK